MMKGQRTAGRPRYSYIGQIKKDSDVRSYKLQI
jgi:hypothetical protein